MKRFAAVVLAGWMGWINTARWEDVDSWEEDASTVAVSTKGEPTPVRDQQSNPQKEFRAPRLHDILLGPPARTWRDVRADSLEEGAYAGISR